MKTQITDKILEYLNGAEAFLSAQVPDFIQQYLTWCFYETLFWLLLPLITLIIFIGASAKLYVKDWVDEEPTPRAVAFGISFIIMLIFLLANFITFPNNALKLIKITKTPKVFLVENVARLIK